MLFLPFRQHILSALLSVQERPRLFNVTPCIAMVALIACILLSTGCAHEEEAVFQPAVAKLIDKANALKDAGQLDKAICKLEAASDLEPDAYQVQYNLGVLYFQASQWPSAIDHLEHALKSNPHEPNGLYTLGYAYESLGNSYVSPPAAKSTAKKPASPTPPDAQVKKHDAFQHAISAYQDYLKYAPANDPNRSDIQNHLQSLKAS